MWEEKDKAATFIAQRRNESGSGLKNTFSRGATTRSYERPLSSAESLLCTSRSSINESTHRGRVHGNPGPQPKALPLGGQVELQARGFVGSKLVWGRVT